jgi:hypothetical protein
MFWNGEQQSIFDSNFTYKIAHRTLLLQIYLAFLFETVSHPKVRDKHSASLDSTQIMQYDGSIQELYTKKIGLPLQHLGVRIDLVSLPEA